MTARQRQVWLMSCLGVLVLAALAVYAPRPAPTIDLPPPVTAAGAAELSDRALADRLVADAAAHRLRHPGAAGGWRSLPPATRDLWVTAASERHLARGSLLTFLLTNPTDWPDLADLRDAYSALGAPQVADAVDAALVLAESPSGQDALTTCRDFHEHSHAPMDVRPPGFSDPFTACEKRLQAMLAATDVPALRAAYARKHVGEALISP